MKLKSMRLFITLLLLAATQLANGASPELVTRTARGKFDDIKERVLLAIENRGLVLNYTARVGEMLKRTGKDIGRTQVIYDQAEVLEFCSARLSRDSMEADPRNILYCPYSIAIYTLPQEQGAVHVGYRKLASGSGSRPLAAIDKLLEDIVREALR